MMLNKILQDFLVCMYTSFIQQKHFAFILFSGFAQENQFQLNPADDTFGNRVTFVSDTRTIPCDVERDSTHGNRITCYTR